MGRSNEGGKEFIMNTEVGNYLELMADSLVKKGKKLEEVLELTKAQETLLSKEEFDEKNFDNLINKKSALIEEINKLDEGFELTYNRVREMIKENPEAYRDKIEKLQNSIRTLVDKGVEIEACERRNQIKFDLKVSKGKDKIRSYNLNSNAVTKYYSNMNGSVDGTTYFVDKKK